MTKRAHYTNSCLLKTIDKDYGEIVHAIVMEAFCGFPNKKLKRSSVMENLAESRRTSSSCDSAYATSDDELQETSTSDLQESSTGDLQGTSISEGNSLINKLNSSVSYFREDSPCFESDQDTLVGEEEFSSVKRTNETGGEKDDKDSLLNESHEDLCKSLEAPASIELNCPEGNSHADCSISFGDVTCLLESSSRKFPEEDSSKNASKQKSNCSEENALVSDSSISLRDVSCLLESSSRKCSGASKAKFNCPEEISLIFESSIKKASLEPSNKAESSHKENVGETKALFNLAEELEYEETIGKIYFEENRIEQLHNLLGIGKSHSGYVGSIPHIAAATKMLIANLTKEALTASIAKKYFVRHPINKISCPKGQIAVENIQLDTDYIGKHGNLPPCYYLVVLEHETTILHTQILAPDAHGILNWNDKLLFDDVSHDFAISMSLYKLQVKTAIKNSKWKKLLISHKRHLPLFELVGKRQITKSNVHKTAFEFNNQELLYADFKLLIRTGKSLMKTPMKLSKVVMKSNRASKVICETKLGQLDGTNLKLFRSCNDTPEVISMVQCKRCKTYLPANNTLEIEYEKTHCSGKFYLTFESPQEFREWRMALNGAMLVSKKWNL